MFGISGWEMVGLAVIALLIFGPDRLPKVAADAGRFIRQMRTMIASARRDLSDSLGPEFKDLDATDLNPRSFVRKHLLDPAELDISLDLDDVDGSPPRKTSKTSKTNGQETNSEAKREIAPFDPDAT